MATQHDGAQVHKFILCVRHLGILVIAMQTIVKISVYKNSFCYSKLRAKHRKKRPFVSTTNETLVVVGLKHRSQDRSGLRLLGMWSEGKSSDNSTHGYCHHLFNLYFLLFPWQKNYYSSYCPDLTCDLSRDLCLRPAALVGTLMTIGDVNDFFPMHREACRTTQQ